MKLSGKEPSHQALGTMKIGAPKAGERIREANKIVPHCERQNAERAGDCQPFRLAASAPLRS